MGLTKANKKRIGSNLGLGLIGAPSKKEQKASQRSTYHSMFRNAPGPKPMEPTICGIIAGYDPEKDKKTW